MLVLVTAGLVAANLFACAATPDPLASTQEAVPSASSNTDASVAGMPTLPSAPELADPDARFERWKRAFATRMLARYDVPGFDADGVRGLLDGLAFQPQLLERDSNQPEFTRPVWSYLDSAVAASRVRPGEENLSIYRDLFDRIEARYGVDREVLTAIWGLESQYGGNMGDAPVPSALATFAFEGRRAAMFTAQLEALVQLVAEGRLDPDGLVGAWAGAMGQTQFMPQTLRDYGVDFDGDGRLDLRGSEADALGSAAHYLARSGWVPERPALVEVALPRDFDYALADGTTRRSVADWTARGVRAVPKSGAAALSALGADEAKLLVPAGHRGPAFLAFKNFDVIKRYNNSTAYAMGISGLADTFRGLEPVVRPWPRKDEALSRSDKEAMQRRLTELGYDTQGVDGVIGPATRQAIRAWQSANGHVADGYVEKGLLAEILG